MNAFDEITQELAAILKEKDLRYGSSTKETYNRYGMVSYLLRFEDKINRARKLTQNPELDNYGESLRDTLLDLAGYAVLALRDFDNTEKEKENK